MDFSTSSEGFHKKEVRRVVPGHRDNDDKPVYDTVTKDFGHFDCSRHDMKPTMLFPRDGRRWCIDCYSFRYGRSPLGDPNVEWTD